MISIEYSEAITETLDILKHTKKEDVMKISPEFMEYLNNNASKTYKPELDHSKKIKDMQLKRKTKAILAIIYIKFWCDTDKQKEFDNTLKNNEIKYQTELREKYNPDNLFKKQHNKIEIQKNIVEDENALVEEKESIFKRFINRIKSIFNVKKKED